MDSEEKVGGSSKILHVLCTIRETVEHQQNVHSNSPEVVSSLPQT